MAIEPHKGWMAWCSNEAVGYYGGTTWVDSWKTGLTNTYHYMLAIRNFMLISNGQYIAGWNATNGGGFSTALLDLQPGYTSLRMHQRKAAGTRQALIQGQYNSDRTKDGIFVWDLASDSPIDFIPVPWLHDFFVENNIIYTISGNQLDISEVVGTQLRYLNSIFDNPLIEEASSRSFTAKFLGKFSNLLLLSIAGQRESAITGDNFYPGLWAYNIENNSLFYWLPPSSGNIYKAGIGDIFVAQQNLWVGSYSTDNAATKYHIDKLAKVSGGSGIFREMYVSPMLNAGSIGTKIWKKIKSAHNRLLTTARILFKFRDFGRNLITCQAVISAVTNTSFSLASANGGNGEEVGDEVTVIGGTGAGQARHITNITGTNPYVYTIDEAWDTNPDTNSIVEIASWKKMSEKSAITNKEKDGRVLSFSQRGIQNQIKLVLEHPSTQSIELDMLKIKGDEETDE